MRVPGIGEMKGEECEKELMGGGGGEGGRRATRGRAAWWAGGALVTAAWLATLTVLLTQSARELTAARQQIQRLQRAVDKLGEWRDQQTHLLTDINAYDDGVFAELDGGGEVVEDSLPRAPPPAAPSAPAAPAHHDDEDLSDDDEESGWYPDYDNRRHEGWSSMVRLSDEDMVGRVRSQPRDTAPQVSKLTQVRHMLRDNRLQSDTAEPGVRAGGAVSARDAGEGRSRRSVRDEAPAQDPTEHAHQHYHQWTDESSPEPSLARSTRYSRQQETAPRRDFIAAHFHGNTSHMTTQTHPHYKGNGLVRVAHDAPHSVWWPAEWTRQSAHPAAPVLTRRGHLRVRHTAIYLVYVQIYYLDSHDSAGWVLHGGRAGSEERAPLLQCATTAPAAGDAAPQDKPNSCFSAAVLRLRRGEALAVRNTGGDRHALMQPEKSFIGLVRLADADDVADDEY